MDNNPTRKDPKLLFAAIALCDNKRHHAATDMRNARSAPKPQPLW
jgi:hypothetical protein